MPSREGKTWRGIVKINGKRVSQKSGFILKRDARAWEGAEKKRFKKPALSNGPDLLTICSKYVVYSERFNKEVYEEKRRTCKRLIDFFGPHTPADTITADMAERYLSAQKESRSANSSNKDRKNLHAMWAKGLKMWGLKSNPFAQTTQLPHDRKPQYTPTPAEVLAILLVADRAEKILLKCYIQTGARRSELFRWTWLEDVNLEKRSIRLGTRKTKDGSIRYRQQPMSDELHADLAWLWKNRKAKNSPYVFTDESPGPHFGKPYTTRRRFINGLCRRAFDPKCKSLEKYINENRGPLFGFHALRRFCASMLADSGKSIKKIQEWLGHQSFRTTEIYIHNLSTDMQDMAEALTTEKLLASVPGSGTRREGEG